MNLIILILTISTHSDISRCINKIFLNLDSTNNLSTFLLVKAVFSCSTSISIRIAITGVFAMSIVNSKSELEIPTHDNTSNKKW